MICTILVCLAFFASSRVNPYLQLFDRYGTYNSGQHTKWSQVVYRNAVTDRDTLCRCTWVLSNYSPKSLSKTAKSLKMQTFGHFRLLFQQIKRAPAFACQSKKAITISQIALKSSSI